jgi:hypothetical protein
MKQCRICKETKHFELFPKRKDSKDGFKNLCSDCHKKECSNWYLKNIDHHENKRLLRVFGISSSQKKYLIEKQSSCCAICKNPLDMAKHTNVDHCHTTGKIRGILCTNCNTGLGKFNDDLTILKLAIHYLEYYAKENTATPVPTGDHRESEIYPELGTFSATWTREDYYDLDHYQRTVRGEDADYRTKTRGGDGVGYGSAEVGTPQAPESEQDDWQLHPAYGWIKS